jgi:NAD+ kinase
VTGLRAATLLAVGRPQETGRALRTLLEAGRRHGVELRVDPEEAALLGLGANDAVVVTRERDGVGLCLTLGGDGTILRALRRFAGTDVPVFAVNFGEVGFLATVEPDELDGSVDRAFRGDFERLRLPALAVELGGAVHTAMNDVSVHRRVGDRVAQLVYAVEGAEVGFVRCDGLVVCTPAGSTGYNLANGGPVLAWGVEGFGLSFIAPHSFTARPFVVAPEDELTVVNRSRAERLEVAVDGRPTGELPVGGTLAVRFVREAAVLAQVLESSFYRRLREKFGRLRA